MAFVYTVTHRGPQHAYRGRSIYVLASMRSENPESERQTVYYTAQTEPVGVTVGAFSLYASSWWGLSAVNSGSVRVRIDIADDAPLGAATLTVRFTSSGTTAIDEDINVIVEEMPAVLDTPEFACDKQLIDSGAMTSWESSMLSNGAIYGTTAKIMAPTVYDGTWFYDGQKVYLQIAEYTGNTSWYEQADRCELVYRDDYVIGREGAVLAISNFAHGITMAYALEDDNGEKLLDITAVNYLLPIKPYWSSAIATGLIRESTYHVETLIQADSLGIEIDEEDLAMHVDFIIGYFDMWFRLKSSSSTDNFIQPFMAGIACSALIEWYEYTVEQHSLDVNYEIDTRIPITLKYVADWLMYYDTSESEWNAWDSTYDNGWVYKIHYADETVSIANETSREIASYNRVLNNLITPVFGWLYKMYGETNGSAYRVFGDMAFSACVGYNMSKGKEFSQLYRASFEYVKWRHDNVWENDNTDPVISAVQHPWLSDSSRYISFTTDKPCRSQVDYGSSVSYGSFVSSDILRTTHRIELEGLSADSTYHFKITTTDSSANEAVTSDDTFYTGSYPATLGVDGGYTYGSAPINNSTGAGESAFVTMPTGNGELLIAYVSSYGTENSKIPNGWSLLGRKDGGVYDCQVLYRDNARDITGEVEFIPVNNWTNLNVKMLRVSGADSSNMVVDFIAGEDGAASDQAVCPSIEVPANESLLLRSVHGISYANFVATDGYIKIDIVLGGSTSPFYYKSADSGDSGFYVIVLDVDYSNKYIGATLSISPTSSETTSSSLMMLLAN